MFLSEFNAFGNCIDFHPGKSAIEPVKCTSSMSGFFSKVNEMPVFIYKDNMIMFIQVDKERWEVNDALSTDYKHNQGKTTFTIQVNGQIVFQLTYPSWWVEKKASSLPGFGTPPDEEEDFFAYIHFIASTPDRRENMLNVWV